MQSYFDFFNWILHVVGVSQLHLNVSRREKTEKRLRPPRPFEIRFALDGTGNAPTGPIYIKTAKNLGSNPTLNPSVEPSGPFDPGTLEFRALRDFWTLGLSERRRVHNEGRHLQCWDCRVRNGERISPLFGHGTDANAPREIARDVAPAVGRDHAAGGRRRKRCKKMFLVNLLSD